MSSYQHRMGLNATLPRSGNYALQAIEGFTMDALNNVISSVPEWLTLLDTLNGQIDSRQAELAALDYRPPTRSLKPKGSTESLLRKDNDDPMPEDENANAPPTLMKDAVIPPPSTPGRSPPTPAPNNGSPPQLFHHSSSPGPTPVQRRTSQRLNPPHYVNKPAFPTVLRKRKTDSLASGESLAPKYRSRSMIIVYYDSAVQLAFEELVKLISASRNAMRKGKMAARMADMKKIAELEASSDEDDETSLPLEPKELNGVATGKVHNIKPSINGAGDDKEENPTLKLEFISTRKMGPSRDSPAAAGLRVQNNPMLGPGRRPLPGFRGSSGMAPPGSFTSIFDELDSGLEWCQSMCEHAAHQFLRDGTCSVEIESVKGRLAEVKQVAEKEAVKVAAATAAAAEKQRSGDELAKTVKPPEESRGMKPIQMRKSFTAVPPAKSLDPGHIEVDDEGFDEEMPPLQWRSAEQSVA